MADTTIKTSQTARIIIPLVDQDSESQNSRRSFQFENINLAAFTSNASIEAAMTAIHNWLTDENNPDHRYFFQPTSWRDDDSTSAEEGGDTNPTYEPWMYSGAGVTFEIVDKTVRTIAPNSSNS